MPRTGLLQGGVAGSHYNKPEVSATQETLGRLLQQWVAETGDL